MTQSPPTRGSRPRNWPAAASVAAAFLATGAIVWLLNPPAVDTEPDTALPSAAAPGPAMVGPAVGAPAIAPAPGNQVAADAKEIGIAYAGPIYLVPRNGLPGEAGTASAWRYSLDGVQLKQAAQALAQEFDAGPVSRQDGGFAAGSTDGTGPNVWVSRDAMGTWYLNDPTAGPAYGCPDVAIAAPDARSAGSGPVAETASEDGGLLPEPVPADGVAVPGVEVDPSPGDPSTCGAGTKDPVRTLTRAQALQAAQDLFASAGMDTQDVTWDVAAETGSASVTAWPHADGQPTAMSWSVMFGTSGRVASASGFLARPVEVPGYQVISARDAILRSHDVRYASLGPTQLSDSRKPLGAPAVGSASTPAAGNPVDPRRPVRLPIDEVEVVDASAMLAPYWQPDGSVWMLPAWKLTAADGRAFSEIALADDFIGR